MSNAGQTLISLVLLLIAAIFIIRGFANIANPGSFWQLLVGAGLAYLGWQILRSTGALDKDQESATKVYRVPIAL